MGDMAVEVVDPVSDYAALMEQLFDFAAIRALFASGFTLRFDAMHAITGPLCPRDPCQPAGRARGYRS